MFYHSPISIRRLAIRLVAAALLGVLVVGGSLSTPRFAQTAVVGPDAPSASLDASPCADYFICQLANEIQRTADYLERNRGSKMVTDDPRNVGPYSEKVRLVYATQAGGYLNMYRLNGDWKNLMYARMRLDYMLLLGEKGLGHGPFDGMEGFIFLQASELMPSRADYRSWGLHIADQCLTYPWLTLDPGFMCDMALAKAYQLSGKQAYLDKERQSTAETASRQYSNGAWPHWDQNEGPSAGYTSWMVQEAYMILEGDPNNPDLMPAVMKTRTFLMGQVNPDGTVSKYPTETAGASWASLSGYAYSLGGLGETDTARQLLVKLFSGQFTGADSGSYADAWVPVPAPWTHDKPSILRTSDIFWDISNLALAYKQRTCDSGVGQTCTITSSNCNAAFAALGQCNQGFTGTQACLNGRPTKCINPALVQIVNTMCTFPAGTINGQYCSNWQSYAGKKACIGAACTACVYNNEQPFPACMDTECPNGEPVC